jgi:excisionase family DNA binding protein
MIDFTRYLTVTQVAEMRGISRQAVLETISRGTLRATKVGNQWLIQRKDLEQFVPHPGGKPKKKARRRRRRNASGYRTSQHGASHFVRTACCINLQ